MSKHKAIVVINKLYLSSTLRTQRQKSPNPEVSFHRVIRSQEQIMRILAMVAQEKLIYVKRLQEAAVAEVQELKPLKKQELGTT